MDPTDHRLPPRAVDPLERIGLGADGLRSCGTVGVLAGLFLLCFIPRLLTAWKTGPVCNDGYYYVSIAQALQQGDLPTAFSYLNLNLYPAILALLHRAGLDWMTAGKLWGAVAASLAVLPMHGWIRRLFDGRVALVACFLYAVHPELIEWSIEPIREATFWLFCMLSLYLLARAKGEKRLVTFALAGTAVAAAIHTRSEGWLLVLPLAGWAFAEWKRAAMARWRLALGVPLCLLMTPLWLFAVNVTLLREHTEWEWGRLKHVQMGIEWINAQSSDEQQKLRMEDGGWRMEDGKMEHVVLHRPSSILHSPSSILQRPPVAILPVALPAIGLFAADADAPPALSQRLAVYLNELNRALGPINLLLLLAGLVAARRSLLRADKLCLLLLSAILLAGVWIQLWSSGINGRYFYLMFLVLIPYEAAGAIAALQWAGRRMLDEPLRLRRQAVAFFCLLATIGWCDVAETSHRGRMAHQAQGEWLAARFGELETVVVNRGAERVGYYAKGGMPQLPPSGIKLRKLISKSKPDMVVYRTRGESAKAVMNMQKVCATVELYPLDVPNGDGKLIVFARRPASQASVAGGSKNSQRATKLR